MSQHSQPLMQNTSHELAIKPSISTLAQGSMFWQPEYRQASPWLEHLPFLFWLVEALKPTCSVGVGVDLVPHFAVCQAISRLRLGGHSYVVGEADAEQTQRLNEYALDQYAGISQWVQANPTRAIQQFDEYSIDLLLLNVAADDDSIDYLVDRWLSRLSSKGVILLPGIARREPGCQAFRAFDALKSQYPHFAFHHASGLGLLVVGGDLPPLVNNLLGALESTGSTQVVQDVFSRLGRSCQDKVVAQEQQAVAQLLEARLNEQAETLATSEAQAKTLSQQHDEQKQAADKFRSRLEQQEERFASERGRLAERVSSLEEFNQELKQELMRQRHQAEQREADLRNLPQLESQNTALVKQVEQATKEHQQANEQHGQALEAQKKQIEKLQTALKEREDSIASLTQQLEKTERQIQQHQTKGAEQQTKLESTQAELEKRNEKIAKLDQQLEKAEQQRETQESEATQWKQQYQSLEAEQQQRFEELATLTKLLEEKEQAFGDKQQEVNQLKNSLQEQTASLEARFNELGKLTRQLQETEEKCDEAKTQAATEKQQRAALDKQVTKLTQQEQEARASIDERFRELAVLTKLLEEKEQQQSQLEAQVKQLTETLAQEQRENERQTKELAALVKRLEESRQPEAASAQSTHELSAPINTPSVRKTPPLTKRVLKRQVAMIEGSRWFDAQWYLQEYPDIARDPKMSAQPARHYLIMGGFEGRNPGPKFDSAYYLATHPDVAESGTNPLVHYLKFGEKEQRDVKAAQ